MLNIVVAGSEITRSRIPAHSFYYGLKKARTTSSPVKSNYIDESKPVVTSGYVGDGETVPVQEEDIPANEADDLSEPPDESATEDAECALPATGNASTPNWTTKFQEALEMPCNEPEDRLKRY